MAQLSVHTAAKAKASSTFLHPSPHFTGDQALRAEEGPQFHRLPKSTGSLFTKNGETRCGGAPSEQVCLGGRALGKRFGLHLKLGFCPYVATPPHQGRASSLNYLLSFVVDL